MCALLEDTIHSTEHVRTTGRHRTLPGTCAKYSKTTHIPRNMCSVLEDTICYTEPRTDNCPKNGKLKLAEDGTNIGVENNKLEERTF